jgi:hypothetical protein
MDRASLLFIRQKDMRFEGNVHPKVLPLSEMTKRGKGKFTTSFLPSLRRREAPVERNLDVVERLPRPQPTNP